jgi:hypothetical protein
MRAAYIWYRNETVSKKNQSLLKILFDIIWVNFFIYIYMNITDVVSVIILFDKGKAIPLQAWTGR